MPVLKPVLIKRPKLPSEIHLPPAAPGSPAAGKAGAYATADGDVTVRIEGDPSGLFQVIQIAVFDLERDPDAPAGSPPVLVLAGSVEGPGPIQAVAGEAVLTTIRFTAPASPAQDAFSATAVMQSAAWPQPVRIPITASVAGIEVNAAVRTLSIQQGGRATANLTVKSLGGPDTQVDFFMVAAPQGIFLDSGTQTTFPVPRGATVPVKLVFTAQQDAPTGTHELQGLEFKAFDGKVLGALDHFLTFDVIPQPSATVVTNLPSDLQVEQGDSILCELRVTLTGGPAQFSVAPSALPAGISVTGQKTITVSDSAFLGLNIEVAPDAALGQQKPLVLTWTFDALGLTGQLTFNIEVFTNNVVYSSGILGPSTVTGVCQVGFQNDGLCAFRGHVREDGAIGHNYLFVMVFPEIVDSDGHPLTFTHEGTVHGLEPGDRADDWVEAGPQDSRVQRLISDNWQKLRNGTRYESRLHVSTDPIGAVEVVGSLLLTLGFAAGVTALIVAAINGDVIVTFSCGITAGADGSPGFGCIIRIEFP